MKPGPAPTLEVAYRDRHFLVVVKPAGLATTSPNGTLSLTELVRDLDPKAPRLHPSSRLDADVTGLVIFARTRAATQSLLNARRSGRYVRVYVALTARTPSPAFGIWSSDIGIHPSNPRLRQANGGRAQKEARTRYETVATSSLATVLHLFPETGRTHQLRVHAAHAGVPMLGDRAYGGAHRIVKPNGRIVPLRRVMLHCARLRVPLPDDQGVLDLRADLPEDLSVAWSALAGGPIPMPNC